MQSKKSHGRLPLTGKAATEFKGNKSEGILSILLIFTKGKKKEKEGAEQSWNCNPVNLSTIHLKLHSHKGHKKYSDLQNLQSNKGIKVTK